MSIATAPTLDLFASDLTGQKSLRISGIPREWQVSELVPRLLARMGLIREDAAGHPLSYRARLDREGRNLNGSETVGEAIEPGDSVTLTPEIFAANA